MSGHITILPPTDGQPGVSILPLEPRTTGEPPRCRYCRRVCNDALSANGRALDPICGGCSPRCVGRGGTIRVVQPPALSLHAWAIGVGWGRVLARQAAAA